MCGQWGSLLTFPLPGGTTDGIADLVVMRTGQVLLVYGAPGLGNVRRYDPQTGSLTGLHSSTDALGLFCGAHSQLGDGRIVFIGGGAGTRTAVYDPMATVVFDDGVNAICPGCFSARAVAPTGRFYPTITTLADGRVLAVGAGDETLQRIPMLYDPILNQWVQLPGAEHCLAGPATCPTIPYSDIKMSIYPHLYQALDGRVVFVNAGPPGAHAPNFTWALTTAGGGSWAKVNPNQVIKDPITGNPSVMYGPNLVLKLGGRDLNGVAADNTPYSIDLSAASPSWVSRALAQHHGGSGSGLDVHYYLLALPNERIMALGFEQIQQGSPPIPEWYHPVLNDWDDLAAVPEAPNCVVNCSGNPGTFVRGYHSAAVVLPDARVLFVGGTTTESSHISNTGNIFSPPYLFKSNGEELVPGHPERPTIVSTETIIGTGSTFTADCSPGSGATSITKACLIRPGSATHAMDFDQRFIPLTFTPGSGLLQFTAPATTKQAPPGYYMLFVLNNGTPAAPSVARFVNVWGIVEESVSVSASFSCNQPSISFDVQWDTTSPTTTVSPPLSGQDRVEISCAQAPPPLL